MKKMIATLLAVCMLLMMIPAIGVSAESAIAWPANIGDNVVIGGETYEYVGDMGSRFDLIRLDESVLDRPLAGRFGAGYFAWDGEDTLVLNNTTGNFEEVYSLIEVRDLNANIVFEGKNVWTVTNEEEYLYVFDLYDDPEINGNNVVVFSGDDSSFELNVTSYTTADVIWAEPTLGIYGLKMDISVSCAGGNGIRGYRAIEFEGSDISLDMTYDAMVDYDHNLILGGGGVYVNDSTLNLKGRDLTEYEEGVLPFYFDSIESYSDIAIDNSVVNIDAESQACAYGLYVDEDIRIVNGSAVEVKGVSLVASYLVGANTIEIDDSYFRSVATGSDINIAIDAREDGGIELGDAELIAPANGTIERYVDEEEEKEGTSVLLPDGTYAAEVVIAPRSYADVSGEQWFAPAVGFATARGLFKGVDADNFAPFMQLTRAQMMTILARMSGANVDPAPGEIWYERAVEWAVENGVSDGTDPNGKITREQMITKVWRYLGEPEGDGDLTVFTDRNKIDSWAEDALAWAVEYGVISGRGEGILDPDGTANRAEAAQLLKNFLINY